MIIQVYTPVHTFEMQSEGMLCSFHWQYQTRNSWEDWSNAINCFFFSWNLLLRYFPSNKNPLALTISFSFRYELFWLPLLAQYTTRTKKWFIALNIAAPLDIAWVWHVHMLSPVSYQRDCNEIVATLVDHKILVGEQRDKGLVKARALWEKLYPDRAKKSFQFLSILF